MVLYSDMELKYLKNGKLFIHCALLFFNVILKILWEKIALKYNLSWQNSYLSLNNSSYRDYNAIQRYLLLLCLTRQDKYEFVSKISFFEANDKKFWIIFSNIFYYISIKYTTWIWKYFLYYYFNYCCKF